MFFLIQITPEQPTFYTQLVTYRPTATQRHAVAAQPNTFGGKLMLGTKIITKDGVEVARIETKNAPGALLEWFHKNQGQSMDWATTHGGYRVEDAPPAEPHTTPALIEPETLRAYAVESLAIPVDPQTGQRPGDPLRADLNAENAAAVHANVEAATGRTISRDYANETAHAAHLRAQLRRWAARQSKPAPAESLNPQILNPQTETAAEPLTFWQSIDLALAKIEAEQVNGFDAVKAILDTWGNPKTAYPRAPHADRAFFAGSGGDRSLWSALHAAGWAWIWGSADYYYVAQHPITAETLTYIEGDVMRGDAR